MSEKGGERVKLFRPNRTSHIKFVIDCFNFNGYAIVTFKHLAQI